MRLFKNSAFLINNLAILPRITKNYVMLITGKKALKTVEIQLTDKCQCKCIHCCFNATKEENGRIILTNEIKRFVDECISLGAFHFNITGGEPLLSDNLFEVIRYIKEKKNIVSLATNGILLSKEMCRKLKDSGLDILEISLDSMNSQDHDAFRRKKRCFNKALNGIRNSRISDIVVLLNTVVTHKRIADGDLNKMVKFVEEEGILLNLNMASAIGRWKEKYHVLLDNKDKEYVNQL